MSCEKNNFLKMLFLIYFLENHFGDIDSGLAELLWEVIMWTEKNKNNN